MASSLLYGQRHGRLLPKPQPPPRPLVYQELFDRPWLIDLPRGYRFHHQERLDLPSWTGALRFFVSNPSNQLLEGKMFYSEQQRVISFNYFNLSGGNEKDLFSHLANHLTDPTVEARIHVLAAAGETRAPGRGLIDSFLSRYRANWHLVAPSDSYLSQISQASILDEMADRDSLDNATRLLLSRSDSLEQLLSHSFGAEVLLSYNIYHSLDLGCPLTDLA